MGVPLSGFARGVVMLFLRVVFGLGLAQIGYAKVEDIPGTEKFLASLGVPAAFFAAWAVAVIETAGGVLMAAGLFSQLAGFLVTVVMSAAIGLAHLDEVTSVEAFMKVNPYNFLVLGLLMWGGCVGMFSIDYLFSGSSAPRAQAAPQKKTQ